MRSFLLLMRTFLRPLLIACGVAVAIRAALLQVYAIPSGSMAPTLQPGDQVIATPYRLPWGDRNPTPGDVVIFRRVDGAPGFFVKRVIATPGDHLRIHQGRVFVNGREIQEPYVQSASADQLAGNIVPAESYFVMGDHRADSIDSRSWGYVPRSAIAARARVVFWSSAGSSPHRQADASAANQRLDRGNDQVRWRRVLMAIR